MKKISLFVLFNIIIFYFSIYLFGQRSVDYIEILISIIIFFTIVKMFKKNRFLLAFTYVILYQLIFDSNYYNFTNYHIRLWYLLLMPLLIYIIFIQLNRAINNNKLVIYTKKIYLFNILIIILFAFLSIAYFFFEPLEAKLYIIKYWLISIGLIYYIYYIFRQANRDIFIEVLDYLIALALFVALWGIIQFHYNTTLGINNVFNNPLSNKDIRPNAFFSETTWYSEYIVFGIIFTSLRLKIKFNRNFLWIFPVFIFGIIISVTRNAFLGLIIFFVVDIILILILGKIPKIPIKTITINKYFIFAILIVVGYISYAYGQLTMNFINSIIYRFTHANMESHRIEAFKAGVKYITQSPLIGHGFNYNYNEDKFSGSFSSAIGSKAFNLFLMIGSIFGIPGLIYLIVLVFWHYLTSVLIYIKTRSIYIRYSIILISVFLSMSMFAPIFQFPFGMYIVGISLSIRKIGEKYNA